MNKITWLLGTALFLFSCTENTSGNRPGQNNGEVISPDTHKEGEDDSKTVGGCYMRIIQRDTIAAYLQQNGESISGRLSFDNFEKDGSTGLVTGATDGDLIKLVYTFQSEGTTSTQQVYFKKAADGIILGIGEMDYKGDTIKYLNPSSLSYDDKEKLKKMDCSAINAKYKK